ncbi:MAG TPA: FtsX-like permease family protein [Solirubrobacteraceae bacterium]|nr:FtsX-like permease family protein [Solirubrobacteraceae bacterium]
MKLSSIVRLYRVRLRARLTQELFAVLGIAIGVALLFASQVANTSLDGSVQRLSAGIVGDMRFQIAGRDARGFDAALLSQVSRLPHVQAIVPVIEQNANLVGGGGERSVDMIGTDPHLAHLGGSIAQHLGSVPPRGARVFAVPPAIAQDIGVFSARPVTVQIGSSSATALLVPQLLARGTGSLGESPVALAPLDLVQRLAGLPNRLTSIYVRSAPRFDRLVKAELERLAGGRLNVRSADITTRLFRRAAGPVDQSTGLFSALSALVGFLFAFNALMLTVPQRRSLIEDLRLDGYTRSMIVQVLALDALVLGVVASVLGLLLGDVLSVAVFSANPGYLSFAFPIGEQRIVTWQSVTFAVLSGMLAAGAGVLTPLRAEIAERRAGLLQLRARQSRPQSWWLLPTAGACLAGTTFILVAEPQAAIVGVVSLTLALLLCLPALLDLVIRASGRLQTLLSGAASYLAVIELRSRSNRPRSLAIAATGAIAVFGSVSIQGARDSLQRGLDASARAIDSGADIWVTPAGTANSLATMPFVDRVSASLAQLPGVREVRLYRSSFLDWGSRRIWVLAPPRTDSHPIAASQLLHDGDLPSATARLRGHGWVVVSQAIASEHHLHTGGTFTLPSTEPTSLRVAALSTNMGWPPGAIVLNADDYARAWASEQPSALQVELAPGASAVAVGREVKQAVGTGSALRVETLAERVRLHYGTASQGLSRLTQIRTLVLIAAVLAMAAAMGAMIWQRRVRLADMKVDGFSRLVLWRSLVWESAILLGLGCAVGAAFGAYGQVLLSRALSVVTGFPVIESSPLAPAASSFLLITAVAVGMVAVPGYVAARVRPAVGLPE